MAKEPVNETVLAEPRCWAESRRLVRHQMGPSRSIRRMDQPKSSALQLGVGRMGASSPSLHAYCAAGRRLTDCMQRTGTKWCFNTQDWNQQILRPLMEQINKSIGTDAAV